MKNFKIVSKKVLAGFFAFFVLFSIACKNPGINDTQGNNQKVDDDSGGGEKLPPEKNEFEKLQTGLPTVYFSVASGNRLKDTKTWEKAYLKILDADGTEIFAETEISAKGRGNSSWEMEKQCFSLKLGEKVKLLDMKKNKRWVLVANHSDKSLLRNDYASYLGTQIFNSEWNPSFKSVNLYYNGEYWGTYLFGEQIKINSNRVDIQDISEMEADVTGDGEITLEDGGFIVEVNVRMDEAFNFTTKKGLAISLKDPDEVDEEIQLYVKNVVQAVEDVIFSENFTDADTGYSKYIDVDSFIDWYFVNEFSKNVDAASTSSIYMYYNPVDKKLHMGPNWDFDLAFGNVNYNNCESAEGGHIFVEQNDDENNPWNWAWGWNGWNFGGFGMSSGNVWITQLMKDSAFRSKVKARWEDKKAAVYDSVNSVIQTKANEIELSADYNFKRWPKVLGYNIFYNATGYQNRKTYKSEVDYLIDWCNKRYIWMDNYLSEWD